MGGCDMPVMINSAAETRESASSVPVIVYARKISAGTSAGSRIFQPADHHQKEFISKAVLPAAPYPLPAHQAAITHLLGGTLNN